MCIENLLGDASMAVLSKWRVPDGARREVREEAASEIVDGLMIREGVQKMYDWYLRKK